MMFYQNVGMDHVNHACDYINVLHCRMEHYNYQSHSVLKGSLVLVKQSCWLLLAFLNRMGWLNSIMVDCQKPICTKWQSITLQFGTCQTIMFVGCQGHLCIEWDGSKAYLFTTKSPFVQNGVALWQLFWMYELFGIVLHDVVSMFREVHFAVVLALVLMHLDWYSHAMLRYSVCPGGA